MISYFLLLDANRGRFLQWLPDKKPTAIIGRPFLGCVFELLTNEKLLGKNSCNISLPNKTHPLKRNPEQEVKTVSELHHGKWWHDTMKMYCDKKKKEIIKD